GAPARSDPELCQRPRPGCCDRHPRSRRRAPALSSHPGHAAGPSHRKWAGRPGARRSARALHAAARIVNFAHVSPMTTPGPDRIRIDGVAKTFIMHLRGGARLPVVRGVTFSVQRGECVVLSGPSGSGKSSILKMIYGNYRVDTGRVLVTGETETVDVASASPRQILALRQTTLGYVSQFLRTIPRVGALDIVAAAAREAGVAPQAARARARDLLAKLNVAPRLWDLPPATFSGGEQQRVNIARCMAP